MLLHSAKLMIPDFSQIFSKYSILILRIFLMILFVAGQYSRGERRERRERREEGGGEGRASRM